MAVPRGCSKVHFGEDNTRFALLAVVILIYMVCGALMFSWLESTTESKSGTEYNRTLSHFIALYPEVNYSDLVILLHAHGNASDQGILDRRPRWDFSGSFYYVGTIVATIGFGMTTPQTVAGKVATMFYGLVGCAGGILFFNLFLERIISLLAFALRAYHVRRLRGGGGPGGRRISQLSRSDVESTLDSYKPSVYWVMCYLFLGACVLAVVASAVYSHAEGWSYLEATYFCFVTFTTIGFGDFVSGQRREYASHTLYQFANTAFIILGCSCVYSLLNVISIVIKQFLNWTIRKLDCQRCRREKPPPLASQQRRNAIAPSVVANGRVPSAGHNTPQSGVCIIEDEAAMYDSEVNSRRNSGEMISMQHMLGLNKFTLALMQKQLYETANRNYIDAEQHPSGGLSSAIGPLAILNEKLGEDT
ncbi:PREDICTED: potassium channel subfamily K member 12-like [Priapulus caudatus]|uniref:Potassium channel subfamily K member 12-like n=1 Tax=Priapulus caudatus TaxID=37621 RepID=A0ABM1E1I2_PRICU|nr:PREDICTED: potassium channel subfamily K member 12-like [Priapulus caudatus]